MHLDRLPTPMKRGEEIRNAYYDVQKEEWEAEGFAVVDDGFVPEPPPRKLPEIVVEAGIDAYEPDSEKLEGQLTLEDMTKMELLDWAMERGVDLKNNLPKAQILAACFEILKK